MLTDRTGQQWGNYSILHSLGVGGIAEVYEGQHSFLSQFHVAIKIAHPHMVNPTIVAEFKKEAQALALLGKHPGWITLHDCNEQTGIPYLVMTLAEGTLDKLFPKGTIIPIQDVVSVLRPIAEALDYARTNKIVHRDVKPENILLLGQPPYQRTVMGDLGIFVDLHSVYTVMLQQNKQEPLGTPHFVPPEQWEGHAVHESDEYALACIVYLLITGQYLFPSAQSTQQLNAYHHLHMPPAPSQISNVPSSIDPIILKALAKLPQDRYPTTAIFWQELEKALTPSPIQVLGKQQVVQTPPVQITPAGSSWPTQLPGGVTIPGGATNLLSIVATGNPDLGMILAYPLDTGGWQGYSFDRRTFCTSKTTSVIGKQLYSQLQFFSGNTNLIAVRSDGTGVDVFSISPFTLEANLNHTIKYTDPISVAASSKGRIAIGQRHSVSIFPIDPSRAKPHQYNDHLDLGIPHGLRFIEGSDHLIVCLDDGRIVVWTDISDVRDRTGQHQKFTTVGTHPAIPAVFPSKKSTPVPYTKLSLGKTQFASTGDNDTEVHIFSFHHRIGVVQSLTPVVGISLAPTREVLCLTDGQNLVFADTSGTILAVYNLASIGMNAETSPVWMDDNALVLIDRKQIQVIPIPK